MCSLVVAALNRRLFRNLTEMILCPAVHKDHSSLSQHEKGRMGRCWLNSGFFSPHRAGSSSFTKEFQPSFPGLCLLTWMQEGVIQQCECEDNSRSVSAKIAEGNSECLTSELTFCSKLPNLYTFHRCDKGDSMSKTYRIPLHAYIAIHFLEPEMYL